MANIFVNLDLLSGGTGLNSDPLGVSEFVSRTSSGGLGSFSDDYFLRGSNFNLSSIQGIIRLNSLNSWDTQYVDGLDTPYVFSWKNNSVPTPVGSLGNNVEINGGIIGFETDGSNAAGKIIDGTFINCYLNSRTSSNALGVIEVDGNAIFRGCTILATLKFIGNGTVTFQDCFVLGLDRNGYTPTVVASNTSFRSSQAEIGISLGTNEFDNTNIPNTWSSVLSLTQDNLLPYGHTVSLSPTSHTGYEKGLWGFNRYSVGGCFFGKPNPVDFSASDTTVTTGDTINFTDESKGIQGWEWDFGDGGSSSLQNPSYVYATQGVYSVSLRGSGPLSPKPLWVTEDTWKEDSFELSSFDSWYGPDFASSYTFKTVANDQIIVQDTGAADWDFFRLNDNPATISGDFNLEVGVKFQNAVTAPPGSKKSIFLALELSTDSSKSNPNFQLGWEYDGDTSQQYYVLKINNPSTNLTVVASEPPFGNLKLRFSRINDILRAYFDTGSGWTEIGSGFSFTDSLPFDYVSVGSSLEDISGPGFSYFRLQAETGFINDQTTLYNETTKINYIVVNTPPAPVASFTASTYTGTAPQIVNFTDTSTGVIDSWSWNFVLDTASTQGPHTRQYNLPGLYNVRLTVSGPGGSDTVIEPINILSTSLSPDFSANARVGTAPFTVQFSGLSTAPDMWTWDFGDGNSQQTTTNTVSHVYPEPGVYSVKLVVVDSQTQDTEFKENYIYVNKAKFQTDLFIVGSQKASTGDYWKLYVNPSDGRLVFETKTVTYVSVEPVLKIKYWNYVEFHPLTEVAYIGSSDRFRRKIDIVKQITSSPDVPARNAIHVAKNSTMKIDEVKVWRKELDLVEYFRATRSRAILLDS